MIRRELYDCGPWFLEELTSRIIAETGIPSDRYHLGKIILQSLKDYPDAILQIDGGTGESETNNQMLERAIRCATSFRNFGLQVGDIIVLMAPNHLDLAVPFYAAFFTGVVNAVLDRTLGVKELQQYFGVIEPKLIFCQSETATTIQLALNEIHSNATIIIFDSGDYLMNFKDFTEKYGDDMPVDNFKATDFDAAEANALLISTSGTTGLPKSAAVTHKNFTMSATCLMYRFTKFPSPFRMAMVGSPLQWLTGLYHYVTSPIFQYTRLQTSLPLTREHTFDLINNYKPSFLITSPTVLTSIIKTQEHEQCDFTCLENILVGGSAVSPDLIKDTKKVAPNALIANIYGMSELSGTIFHEVETPVGSCGTPMRNIFYRLIDIETQEMITEPNVSGELWLKGPKVFKGYYKNDQVNEESFTEDGWFKTGDMFYRDENWNYFFTERIKLMLKYKSYQISPVELENVIRQHPSVVDVAVTGIPDPECGDLAVACVVPREGENVTADEIKDLVRNSLSDSKQLRGGVIFLESIPITATTKVDRRKLKEIAKTFTIH